MRKKQKNRILHSIIGTIILMTPMMLLAQNNHTYTAPDPAYIKKDRQPALALNNITSAPSRSAAEPRIEIVRVLAGNADHIEPGFYATYQPKMYDTVFIYEGSTEQFQVIEVHSGKEVIRGDSVSVSTDVNFRMNHFNEKGIPVTQEKNAKTNSIIVRSGVIPAQGFGSKRYRFAVKPAAFDLSGNSMISASVHMANNENIGTVLCAVTNIDYKKGIFYVETSNEIPLGENINWIIVNTP
jgi:hypothetical protein